MPDPARTDAGSEATAVVVLAAGQGSRMRSALPKPLHLVAGRPMAAYVLDAAAVIPPWRTVLVVGNDTRDLASRLGRTDLVSVQQASPHGTGDALRCALPALDGADWIVVLFPDHPLLTAETVARFVVGAREAAARVTVLTCWLPEAEAFGRIKRDTSGQPTGIVEAKDDVTEDRIGPTEINSGMMVFEAGWVRDAIGRLTPSPATGEFYMTELVAMAVADGPMPDGSWPVATVTADPAVAYGINDRRQLAQADAMLRERIRRRLMADGVTFVGPETIFVDADVEIGQDTTILPHSIIRAGTRIGRDCTIGPTAILERAMLADGAVVRSSTVVDSRVGPGADVGPYAHVRGDTTIGAGAHVGSYAELKAVSVGARTMIGHFSYVGDATIGADVNIGAGVVTANYDGREKHHTEIGDDVFIGSDTVLVAPVRIGNGARTGAGAVVTRDVAPGETVVGVPARVFRRVTDDRHTETPERPEEGEP